MCLLYSDIDVEFISDLDETPLCESPDAYMFIANYICQQGHRVDQSTSSPSYPGQYAHDGCALFMLRQFRWFNHFSVFFYFTERNDFFHQITFA